MIPERTINHHFTYHVVQASQAKHGSLAGRGANGGLSGSDVRILSRSSRKCNVTGIDSHELQGLDVVQCAALIETNHGIVNLIMNEYACYGKGHTIHSSGQIEWFKNSVDDRSVQVGGKQRFCTVSVAFQVLDEGEKPLPGWSKASGHIVFDVKMMAMLCH